MLDVVIEAGEIESVEDVIFFNLAEILVAFRREEP